MNDDRSARVDTTDHQDARSGTPDADPPGAGDPGTTTSPGRSPRRRRIVAGLVAGVAAIAVVLWWFEPQALLIDDVVDEEFPIVADTADAADAAAATDQATPDGEAADGEVDADDGDGEAADDASDGVATPGANDDAGGEATPRPDADAAPAGDASVPTTGPIALRSGDFSSRNRYEVTGTATAFALDVRDDAQRVLRLEDFESTNGPDLFVYLTRADAAAADGELDADFVDLGVLTGNIGNQNYVIPAEVDLDVYDTVVIWCRRFATSFGVADLSPADG